MSSSMKEALKKAYEAKGIELPARDLKKSNPSRETIKSQIPPQNYIEQAPSGRLKNRSRVSERSTDSRSKAELPENLPPYNNTSAKKSAEIISAPDFVLNFSGSAVAKFNILTEPENYVYKSPRMRGHETQAHDGKWRDEREVVIGLDFGTSSVKVIIGDRTLEKAFAVPFSDADGVKRYLLPSRLYENGSSDYSLSAGKTLQRDLKLALLAYPDNPAAHLKVTAFLALVIKHARGWLLSNHSSVYQASNILWKLVVGVPSANHLNSEHQSLFLRLATAAWEVSVIDSPSITLNNIHNALNEKNTVKESDLAEICVVPEIAAQIYGYISSNSFDPKARNNYLMVDIGAGTVDSCLFNVTPGPGGKCDFKFFTTQVQANGVMNLHRYRMDWWLDALKNNQDKVSVDLKRLANEMFCTDLATAIPESFGDYFTNVAVSFKDRIESPDQYFFMKRIVKQVRGETLWRTWRDGYLAQDDLSGIPMYLCGGGARMKFYSRLEEEMPKFQGCSWLSAISRVLEVPKRLVAPGLSSVDYDRLSVAFGLSFLEVRKVIQATPAPLIPPGAGVAWDTNYVSKDMC